LENISHPTTVREVGGRRTTRTKSKPGARFFLAATLIGLLGVAQSTASAQDTNFPGTRVQSWAVGDVAFLPAVTSQFASQTLREVVRTSVGGDQVRVRIANTFGTAPLVIGAAHVAVSAGGAAIVPGTDRALTFGGRSSVTIAAGAPAISDPVGLHLNAVSDVAVSLYLPDLTQAGTTTFLQGNSYVSPVGDFTASNDIPAATKLGQWPFVSGISVSTSRPGAAIVAITD